jgi:tetratricopeptide (TPR) repeat protein
MKESQGRSVHGQAEKSREQGKFIESLEQTDKALVLYQQDNDWFGFCDVLSSRVITLRHLYENTGKKEYLIVAKHEALAAIEVAKNNSDPSVSMMPYMNLGRIQDTLGEFKDAAESYSKAVEIMQSHPPKEHNRPGVLADMKVHKEVVLYKLGDKSVVDRVLQALSDLEKTDEPKYNKDVWMSGGYMKLAEALKEDNTEKAKEYLDQAKKIIDANPQLTLRARQWEKLAKTFSN